MSESNTSKSMTHGEAGLMLVFSLSAFLCLFAAAKALDTAFAFHASLASAASLWAVFAIVNRYFDRPASLPAREINGRPNYNMGPIKFAAALPIALHDTRLRLGAAKTVDDRLQSGVLDCELRFESRFLLLRRQIDQRPRRDETALPEARLEVRDRHHLLLFVH